MLRRLAVALLLFVPAQALAGEPASSPSTKYPAPRRGPAPRPAPASRPAADHSTPEKTWAGVCAALKTGDLESFRGGFYNRNEIAKMFMDAYSDATVTTFDLAGAIERLGKDGQQMRRNFATVYTDLVKTGENHKSETVGELIRWTREEKTDKGTSQEIIFFKQVKNQWLIDTVETYGLDTDAGREGAEKLIVSLPKITATLKQVAADIRSGKITTVDEVRKRLAAAR
jgi:hypothetical protein